jgi:pyrophosphatase PpaX
MSASLPEWSVPDLDKVRGVVFDLDGTLLDSYTAHFEAYLAMFTRFGIAVTAESFGAMYSPNWYQVYEAVGLPRELWKQADTCWLEEAARHAPLVFPGVKETLEQLQAHYRLGIVTAGSKSRVTRDLEKNGIGAFFETVITGDDVQRPKPAPQGLEFALRALGLGVAEALYVGDTMSDYETARAAGVRFVGVSSQFSAFRPELECAVLASIPDLLHGPSSVLRDSSRVLRDQGR